MAHTDEHHLAIECRAALANATMMGEAQRHGVQIAFKHVAHALWLEDDKFDQRAFFAECGLDELAH